MATVFTEIPAVDVPPEQPLIMQLAEHGGNLTDFFSESELMTLGAQVVEDYQRDETNRADWKKTVEEALKSASQEGDRPQKNYPFQNASDVQYPILTIAATEFWARAYPAIVKGDDTVQVKIIGSDRGRPIIGPDGQQAMEVNGQVIPATQLAELMQQAMQEAQQTGAQLPPIEPQPAWEIPPGAKTARAERVKEYLNVLLNYRMDDWELDTSALLYQLPIVGCGFRKVWWDVPNARPSCRYVPALRLVVPMDAPSLEASPRITEIIPDVFPYQIRQRMARGEYRKVELGPSMGANNGDDEAPRTLLEQHRLIDLDEDGYDEPYIVTVDKETSEVLSILAAYDPADVEIDERTGVTIDRVCFYVQYNFLPHPEGKFYGIGFGHLLSEVGAVINTAINQMIDAGHAQIAGGGFMAAGMRLQSNGQTNTIKMRPGEYKFVSGAGSNIRDAIFERTYPNASNTMFSVLELMLGAAKDVAAIKDVLSGDAGSANMPVGTTLALIEQGLQVFSAIYKLVYLGLKGEFNLDYRMLGRYGTEATAADYMNILDDRAADFEQDFNASDMNIRPVSDPGSVTRAQKIAKAQFLKETAAGNPFIDQREVTRRVLESVDTEDIEKLMPEPDPNAPPPPEAVKLLSEANKNNADAEYSKAKTAELGVKMGKEMAGADDAVEAGGGNADRIG